MIGLQGRVANSVANDLLSSTITSKVDEIKLTEGQKTYILSDILFSFNIDNLDVASLEALQTIDPEDEKAMQQISQKMLSRGIKMSIPDSSIKKIEENKELNAYIDVNNVGDGVPIAIKDNIQVKDWSITSGSKILQGYIAIV